MYKYILTTLLASKAPTLGIGQVNFSSSFWVFRFFLLIWLCWFFFCVNQFWFLNLIWVHFLWKIISQVLEIIIWVWLGQALSQLYPSLVKHKRKFIWCPTPFILYLWVCSQRQLAFWLPCSHTTSKISLWPSKK